MEDQGLTGARDEVDVVSVGTVVCAHCMCETPCIVQVVVTNKATIHGFMCRSVCRRENYGVSFVYLCPAFVSPGGRSAGVTEKG